MIRFLREGIAGMCLVLAGCANETLPGAVGNGPSPVPLASAQGQASRVASQPAAETVPSESLVLLQIHSEPTLQLRVKGRIVTLKSPDDFVLESRRLEKSVVLSHSDWVFVGYGVSIPALGWDNYEGFDVHGKTVVMLAGHPPIPDGAQVASGVLLDHPVAGDLGNWQAKFDNARHHGAAMAIILHDASRAVPSYDRLARFDESVMAPAAGNADVLTAFGWAPESRASLWMKRAGVKWEELKRKARLINFQPVELPIQTELHLSNRWKEVEVTLQRRTIRPE
jgi:hypothetical protein